MLISVAASRVQTIISVCFSNPYFKLIFLKPDTGLLSVWFSVSKIHVLLTPLEVVLRQWVRQC